MIPISFSSLVLKLNEVIFKLVLNIITVGTIFMVILIMGRYTSPAPNFKLCDYL